MSEKTWALERPWRTWEDSIKIDLIGFGVVDWFNLSPLWIPEWTFGYHEIYCYRIIVINEGKDML